MRLVQGIARLSNKRPFIFFSAILLLYTTLQLLISYHIIETEFSSHHHPVASSPAITQQQEHPHHINNEPEAEFVTDTFEGCDPIHIDYEWGKQQFADQRIACMILSLYPRNKILMQFIGETYGKLCDAFFFILDDSKTHWFNTSVHSHANKRYLDTVHYASNQAIINEEISEVPLRHLSTYFGGTVIQLNLSRASHHTARNTWEKVHRMYTYFYVHYLHRFDWFVRIDDDVLVSMLNLRDYLAFFDANSAPYYIGHTLLDRWRHDNIVYNAGNLHVMNRIALSKLGPLLMTLPTAPSAHSAHAHCMDFVAGNDDPHLGVCLSALGIYPLNTLDYELKNRFMVFRNDDHYNIKREQSWYWRERPFAMGQLKQCCNRFAINDHPWIHISAQLEWRLKFIQQSESKWNNRAYIDALKQQYLSDLSTKYEVIPPKPCTFMYNINQSDAFVVDEYYNIESHAIPRGQRISFGEGESEIMKCHRCKIGDKDDIYWTNEWDRNGLLYQINDSNKQKFYEISQYFPNRLISTRFEIDDKLQSLIDQALDPNIQRIVHTP